MLADETPLCHGTPQVLAKTGFERDIVHRFIRCRAPRSQYFIAAATSCGCWRRCAAKHLRQMPARLLRCIMPSNATGALWELGGTGRRPGTCTQVISSVPSGRLCRRASDRDLSRALISASPSPKWSARSACRASTIAERLASGAERSRRSHRADIVDTMRVWNLDRSGDGRLHAIGAASEWLPMASWYRAAAADGGVVREPSAGSGVARPRGGDRGCRGAARAASLSPALAGDARVGESTSKRPASAGPSWRTAWSSARSSASITAARARRRVFRRRSGGR